MPEITANRKKTKNTQISTKDNEHREQYDKVIKKNQQLVSNNPQLKAIVSGFSVTSLVLSPKRLQNIKLEK